MSARQFAFPTLAVLALGLLVSACASNRPPPAGPAENEAAGTDPATISAPTEQPRRRGWFSRALGVDANTPNAGPCPYVRVLYDASRFVEIDGAEQYANVGYTGEIQNVTSFCRYTGADPVEAEVTIDFDFGLGPKAVGTSKPITYWVAVTRRNIAPIAKETFTITPDFSKGQTRVSMTDTVNRIIIPRASSDISGGNFEILVGFELTPQQLAFNRDGKRFRVDAGPPN